MKVLSCFIAMALLAIGSVANAARLPRPVHTIWAAKPVVAQTDFVRRGTKYNSARWGSRAFQSLQLRPVYIHPYPNGKIGF